MGEIDKIGSPEADRGILLCPNHTNWWDGFVCRLLSGRYLSQTSKPKTYLMQEEQHLQRYKFFRTMGVFGIDFDKPAAGMRYALKLLENPKTHLWMFPQARLRPAWQPIEPKRGAEFLARKAGCAIVPINFRYEWLVESKPSIIIQIGKPLTGTEVTTAKLRGAMQALHDDSTRRLAEHSLEDFESVFPPKMSVNRAFDRVRQVFGLDRDDGEFNRQNR